MTYAELKIHLDLLDQKGRCDFIKENLPSFDYSSSKLFAVCDEGDCHLFDNDGNECDINEVKEIEEFEYNYKKLTNIKIPNAMLGIKKFAFFGCINLRSVIISDHVKNIDFFAFNMCSNLINVSIVNSVTNIGTQAFRDCSKLICVSISSNIMNIGSNAFYNCNKLKNLIFKNKTIDKVKSMDNYPWGIEDESIIRCT